MKVKYYSSKGSLFPSCSQIIPSVLYLLFESSVIARWDSDVRQMRLSLGAKAQAPLVLHDHSEHGWYLTVFAVIRNGFLSGICCWTRDCDGQMTCCLSRFRHNKLAPPSQIHIMTANVFSSWVHLDWKHT